jgi:general secretion pathway protein J
MTSRRSGNPQAGFTLVELLVAMTLLSFLTLLLFGGLQFGTRAWERSQESYGDEKALRGAAQMLMKEIALAYPLPLPADARQIDFDGEPHSLTWLSAAPTDNGAMTRLRLYQDDGQKIALMRQDELADPSSPKVHPILGGIDAFELRYFGRRVGEKSPRWGSDWRGQPRLPDLVHVIARIHNARAASLDLTVAPRLAGDAGCLLDALSNDCRGRQ